MGCSATSIRGLCKIGWVTVRGGGVARAVVDSYRRGTSAEYHAKIDFTAAIDQQRREFDRRGEG